MNNLPEGCKVEDLPGNSLTDEIIEVAEAHGYKYIDDMPLEEDSKSELIDVVAGHMWLGHYSDVEQAKEVIEKAVDLELLDRVRR